MTSTLRRPTLALFALSLTVGCAAVDDADSPDDQRSDALYGAVTYGADCTPTLRAMAEDSMRFGRITAGTRAFAQCVSTRMRERYRGCTGDAYNSAGIDAQVMAALLTARTPNAVSMSCTGGGGLASTGQNSGYGHSVSETFSWSTWLADAAAARAWPVCGPGVTGACRLSVWPMSQGAATVWHEAAHTHGYGHGHNTDNTAAATACAPSSSAGWNFQSDTVPYIIGNCIAEVLERSDAACGGNVESCGAGQLRLVDGFSSNTCACQSDPAYTLPTMLFYNPASPPDATARVDLDGTLTTLRTFSDLSAGWTHIVSPGRKNLFYYNRNSGLAAVERIGDDGSHVTLASLTLPAGYTQVTPAGVDGLVLLYNQSTGASRVMRVEASGALTSLRPFSLSAGWSHIVESGGLLYFYNASNGTGAILESDLAGNFTQHRTLSGGTLGWTHITGADGMLMFYQRGTGAALTARLTREGLFGLQSIGFSAGWDQLVAVGYREVLIYRASDGLAVTGRLDFTGSFAQQRVFGLSAGWGVIAPRR